MTQQKQGRAGNDRAAKSKVRRKLTPFAKAMQHASSSMARGNPASARWAITHHAAVARMLAEARRQIAICPERRELYYGGHRLHLRCFGGWLLILDSRHRPLAGPFRLHQTPTKQRGARAAS